MIRQITRDELRSMFTSAEKFKLVDVLSRDSFENEHIECAISIPFEDLEKMAPRLLRKNEKIVVYCANFDCQASTQAAEKLTQMGFTDVLHYKGGLKDYKEGGFPLGGRLHDTAKERSVCTCTPC